MRIASLDCFAGIAGDMFLGALIDAGVPPQVLHDATATLDLGASLRIETVNRSGISCTKVHVLANGQLADAPDHATHDASAADLPRLHETSHIHPHKHNHSHEQPQSHGRSLSAIRTLIQATSLAKPVKLTALRAFDLLGHSEAKIHNVPVDEIHFHEVGAVDAIVDIVASAAGIHHLQIDQWFCSPLNVGSGTVVCDHGTFPVPAPATADLLRGLPTYSAHVQQELVTPTGAALIRAIAPNFEAHPVMLVERIGYGAGTRNTPGFPNVLSLSIGESSAVALPNPPNAATGTGKPKPAMSLSKNLASELEQQSSHHDKSQIVTVLETALDDLSPQVLAYVAETALATGALDVMLTPVIMKKGRPGTLLTILCRESESAALQHLIFSETTSIGIRIRQDRRICLDRTHATVQTEYGPIRMKIATSGGEELNAAPEFEDCRTAAIQNHVPLKRVQQTAITAFHSRPKA